MDCNDITTFYPYLIAAGIVFAVSIFMAFKCQDDLQKKYPDKDEYLAALKDLHKGGEFFNPEKPRIYQMLSILICAFVAFNYYQCIN